MSLPVRIRCDQNRLFGCGRTTVFEGTVYTIGVDRLRVMAAGRCPCCLPLALVRDVRPAEREVLAS